MDQQTFTISLFESVGDTRPQAKVCTWPQLCAGFAKPKVRQEKDGQLFSPAKYSGPRRLIENVLELSLLVMEIDGAWRCDSCGHKAPLVKFLNKRLNTIRCQPCHKAKVPEPHAVTQVNFDLQTIIDDCRAFHSAFAIYSTHSHRQFTDRNTHAEPRYRIVVPLSESVPVAEFPKLWDWALGIFEAVPIDAHPNPNCIFYTPVKFSDEAPYEFHIEPGEQLDWKKVIGGSHDPSLRTTAQTCDQAQGAALQSSEAAEAAPKAARDAIVGSFTGNGMFVAHRSNRSSLIPGDIYASHESRHEELCRRIMARGKMNSRGNCDARCLAHGGKGTTAVLYNPRSGAVSCNRGCTYEELLRAEGLDDRKLPSAARAGWQDFPTGAELGKPATSAASPAAGTATVNLPSGSMETAPHSPPPVLTLAKLHVINALLLAHLFELTPEDETTVRRYWQPFAEDIEWPGSDDPRPIKVCSFPSRRLQLEAAKQLSQEFALEGVPGFYQLPAYATEIPGPEGDARKAEVANYGIWRVALDQYRMKPGALLAPYDNGSGYICGIRIFRSVRDKCPFLLTSRNLPAGAKAVGYQEAVA